MLFNSLTYLLFLLLVFIIYWFLSRNYRIYFLTISSFIFYGFWNQTYLILIVFISLIDYLLALKIDSSSKKIYKKLYLIISISANIGLLIFFKYLYFFITNLNIIGFELDAQKFNFILPLGISFFTFEAISYNVDIYRKQFKPEKNYIYYFCFIAFFPKLIAGPVLRAKNLIPQLTSKIKFNWTDTQIGIQRIIIGLFLKVVIADNISSFANDGFLISNSSLSAIDVFTLAFIFGIQIYLDFSAYSSIAIGSARLFGVKISENFNFPYQVTNPKDFWKKWHISLSDWIKDYLYIPLMINYGGNKNSKKLIDVLKRNSTLIITWSIMGFWHGANWTFILWGLLHSLLIISFRILGKFWNFNKGFLNKIFAHIITLTVVMISWIPFRAISLSDALTKYEILLKPSNYTFLGMRENVYLVTFLLMIGIYLMHFLNKYHKIYSAKHNYNLIINFIIGLILVPLIIAFLRPINQFIYFQF
jgi:D-alanyl-lipoteichoic acid acyltransferase DltB (MBOAT superfamily)